MDFGLDIKRPWAQLLIEKRFIRVTENEGWLYWTLDASGQNGTHFLKNHPNHKTRIAPLICRVVRAVRVRDVRGVGVGAGLGFPVGGIRSAPVNTPNLRFSFLRKLVL